MRTLVIILLTFNTLALQAQFECLVLSPTSFESPSGDCLIPNASNRNLKTARVQLQNNCDRAVEVYLEFDGEQVIPNLSALHRKLKLEAGGSKELTLCNVRAQSGTWFIKEAREISNSVSFILRNESLSSIPLIIPGIMNPNLSPRSNSGVRLKYGQEIYFKEGRKKYLLLIVDESIRAEQKLDVAALIKQRRKELGL